MEPLRGFALSAIVLLSLILPLTASSWQTAVTGGGRKTYLVTVWVGQLIGTAGGMWAITAPIHPEFGFVVAVVGCLVCLPILRRQLRTI
jgi:hypothetical protein